MNDFPTEPYSLSNRINTRNNEYYGNYRGTVLDNDDPEGRGRCKVFVYGVYDESFLDSNGENLPWSEPCQPLFCGGGGSQHDNGTFQCPDVSSSVYVFFESGDITKPVMFGQTTDKNGKFSTDHCLLKWEGMSIDLLRDSLQNTNTITISADTTINEIANTNSINRNAGSTICDYAPAKISIEAGSGDVEINGGNNVYVHAASTIYVDAEEVINMTAPTVNVSSMTVNVTGNTTIDGTCHITGATTIDSATTVNADVTISNISFLNHTHTCSTAGSQSSPPTK